MSAVFKHLVMEDRLNPTSLELVEGALVGLVGPNGSGKTSLLRTMAGISGNADVRTNGADALETMPPARRSRLIGYLPASRALAWPIPVCDLLTLSAAPVDETRVEALVERLELGAFLDRPSNQLSTGERARVLLARTLAAEPRLLLLDEPLANLDPYWVLTIAELLAQEAKGGRMVVAALHDLAQAERFDRLLLMHEGRLALDGPPSDVMADPAFAAAFRLRAGANGLEPA